MTPRRPRRARLRAGNLRLLKWISVFAVCAGIAITFLLLSSRCDTIGKKIQSLERQKKILAKRLANEERNWSTARDVANVERLLAHHGMLMRWPAERDTIRISKRPDESPPSLYADGSATLQAHAPGAARR